MGISLLCVNRLNCEDLSQAPMCHHWAIKDFQLAIKPKDEHINSKAAPAIPTPWVGLRCHTRRINQKIHNSATYLSRPSVYIRGCIC